MEKVLDVIKFAQESCLSKDGQLKVIYDAYSKWLRRVDFAPSALVESAEAREAAQQSVSRTAIQPLFCPDHQISYNAVDGCPECDRRR